MIFNSTQLYVIQRGDFILPTVYDTHTEAKAGMKRLAPGFTYSIGTVTIPPGSKKEEFKKVLEDRLRGQN